MKKGDIYKNKFKDQQIEILMVGDLKHIEHQGAVVITKSVFYYDYEKLNKGGKPILFNIPTRVFNQIYSK